MEITRLYGVNEWREDVKGILRKASATDQHGVFLFTDTQIKEEAFLEDVSNLMNSGEVPNLFTTEEKVELCEKMRQLDRQRDKSLQTDGSPPALFNFFVQIVREQLHLILAMSPIGDSFRNRIRKFPALVNCCTIDWFQVFKFCLKYGAFKNRTMKINSRIYISKHLLHLKNHFVFNTVANLYI